MRAKAIRRVGACAAPHLIGCAAAAFLWASAAAASPQGFATFAPGQIVRSSVVPTLPETADSAKPLLSAQDQIAFKAAYEALNDGNWPRALANANAIKHPVARKLIRWGYLSDERSKPSFEEIVGFLDEGGDWPRQETLLEKAEEVLPASMSANRIVAWFGGQEPLTGEGMVRLGEALIETGQFEYGTAWIVRAWQEHDFSDARQSALFTAYRKAVEGAPTAARMTRLLWTGQTGQADWLKAYVPTEMQRIAGVRIALMRGASGADTQVLNLPKEAQSDAGILFDLARYYRRRGEDGAAQRILMADDTANPPFAEKWWLERNYQTRECLEQKRYTDAYRIVSRHGLEEGSSFADAEWLAGWIALRFLDKPKEAAAHFKTMSGGVSYPISLARAHYWHGRALEASGDVEGARAAFGQAAAFPYTYYGQLAAESPLIGLAGLALPDTPAADMDRWPAFIDEEMTKAIRLLNEIEGERYMRSLAFHLADMSESEGDLVLLSEMMRQIAYPSISVRIAKKASQKQILLADYLYPLMGLPAYVGKGKAPEPALVLGLSRQESEFNPKAVSSAGARGLMQLMPATARLTANKHGLPYRAEALLTDPAYNMQIGMAHLGDLLERFDGSYILIIAAYNAGSGRVDEWLARNGDPRKKGVDPVDWIELIPFSETRNYVQRVMENALVYRHRIAGEPIAFTLSADLRRTSTTPIDLAYVTARARRAEGAGGAAPRQETPASPTQPAPQTADRTTAPTTAPMAGADAEVPKEATVAKSVPSQKAATSAPAAPPSNAGRPAPSGGATPSEPSAPTPSPTIAEAPPEPGTMAPVRDDPPAENTNASAESGREPAVASPSLPIAESAEDAEKRATAELNRRSAEAIRPAPTTVPAPTGEDAAPLPSGAMKPGAEPQGTAQSTWQIPDDCQRFVIHSDGSGECIDETSGP